MNLSQDEINALVSDPPADELDMSGDIMTPEAIAAMLDDASGGGAPEPADDGGGDIMSPEAIAAMLDGAASGSLDEPAEDTSSDMMTPEDIAALLDGAGGGDDIPEVEATLVSEPEAGNALANVPALEGMLTEEEIDILGEVGNISMGAVATTMYALLDRRVSITTPRVSVFESKDVLSVYQVPFVIATIEYTKGITGTNLLVLKVEDAALITDILMGGDGTLEEPIELNEMHLSAMSEIMNQMMGASSTSLSKLLGTPIDIAPPHSTTVEAGFDVSNVLGAMDKVTKISFDMEIEGLLKSELIQLVPYDVSRQFAKQFMDVDSVVEAAGVTKPAEAAPPPPPPVAAAPPPPPPPPPPQAAAPPPQVAPPPPAAVPPPQAMPYPPAASHDPYQQGGYPPMQYPQMPYQQPYQQPYPPAPMAGQGRVVDVHPMQFQAFDQPSPPAEQGSIGLVYNIPLQVSVELGRTKKEISEILEFNLGTIVVLDKLAGDPVEIVVNGKLIARGEVVVIDDNYGVRITDIVNG
ncbi:MAG: flagellar motor switch phosphatase FliY [Oscillospiraceae bacterium]|jgi:flagellar motor switch protein FliN/FliY|nr:flagellar motor switch phosphatase FliY [Oscillospiraceae bacterium]